MNTKTPKQKRRSTLNTIKAEINGFAGDTIMDPVDKGLRTIKRKVNAMLKAKKSSGELVKSDVKWEILDDTGILCTLYMSFPDLDEITVLDVTIISSTTTAV